MPMRRPSTRASYSLQAYTLTEFIALPIVQKTKAHTTYVPQRHVSGSPPTLAHGWGVMASGWEHTLHDVIPTDGGLTGYEGLRRGDAVVDPRRVRAHLRVSTRVRATCATSLSPHGGGPGVPQHVSPHM